MLIALKTGQNSGHPQKTTDLRVGEIQPNFIRGVGYYIGMRTLYNREVLYLLMVFLSQRPSMDLCSTFASLKIIGMDRVKAHNREVMMKAEYRADEMTTWPSPLEARMQEFLDRYGIRYESQKIFYIYADDGWIVRYYIADFYIPDRDIIIEVDGKFHEDQKQHDRIRTKTIQEQYPDVEVLRYTWGDLSDGDKMLDLLWKIN